MQEETKAAYRKLAHYHFKQMEGKPVYSNVKSYLELKAKDLRPDYFRKLRNAMALVQKEAGYHSNAKQINSIKNPVTANSSANNLKSKATSSNSKQLKPEQKTKPKQNRVRHLSIDELNLIRKTLKSHKDKTVLAVFAIVDILGCRPAEIENIKIMTNNKIYIQGAKKTKSGNRGLDRIIILPGKHYKIIVNQVLRVKNTPNFKMKNYQSKIEYQMKKLFPRRKHKPNLYTLRHMHGTKLKNSDLTKKEVAYLMGHQSTASVSRYGDKRQKISKSSVKVTPGVSEDKINQIIRDKSTDFKSFGKQNTLPHNPDSFDFT